MANQRLLATRGYKVWPLRKILLKVLKSIDHDSLRDEDGNRLINCDDGTVATVLNFKEL